MESFWSHSERCVSDVSALSSERGPFWLAFHWQKLFVVSLAGMQEAVISECFLFLRKNWREQTFWWTVLEQMMPLWYVILPDVNIWLALGDLHCILISCLETSVVYCLANPKRTALFDWVNGDVFLSRSGQSEVDNVFCLAVWRQTTFADWLFLHYRNLRHGRRLCNYKQDWENIIMYRVFVLCQAYSCFVVCLPASFMPDSAMAFMVIPNNLTTI